MAELEQHGDRGGPCQAMEVYAAETSLGIQALSLPGIGNRLLPSEPSFQFQAEKVLGQSPQIGVLSQGVIHMILCIYLQLHCKGGVPVPSCSWGVEAIMYF